MTRDRLAAVQSLVEGISAERVLVGIPAEQGYRRAEPGEPPMPINNADIGWINEFGSPAQNIPPRPHLVPGVRNARERIGDLYESAARAVIAGKPVAADQAHHAVGLVAQAAVRAEITNGGHAPLSPVTIAKRRARKRTGTKPLIDTGQYRNAINYVVRPVDK